MGLSPVIQSEKVLVTYGYYMQAHGLVVWQHPKFGGVSGGDSHNPASFHFDNPGGALDVYTTPISIMHRVYASLGRPKANAVGLSITSNYYGIPQCGDHTAHWHIDFGTYSDEGRGVFRTPVKPYNVVAPLVMQRHVTYKNTQFVHILQHIVGAKSDGVYGPATKTAVVKWQKTLKVNADGIAGPKTISAYLAKTVVKHGSTGLPTEMVQFIVGVTPDGKAGNNTEAAIKLYQWLNGITDDGEFGKGSAAKVR